MNSIKYLSGASEADCKTEKETVEKDITQFGRQISEGQQIPKHGTNDFPVYILKNSELRLYQYIDKLHDDYKLPNKVLAKFHICKYIDFKNNVSFTNDGGKNEIKIPNIEFLLKKLEPGKHCTIIIDNNDRSLLADIMQQLIYIDYPVSEINVSLRKEFKDAERTRAFMRKIDLLDKTAKEALEKLKGLQLPDEAKNDASYVETKDNAIKAFSEISQFIDKARDVEMKIAVAASKKTGKSAIVNCMLGMELAPTSLEMATPNCCTYKKSKDGNFHLSYRGMQKSFPDSEKIFAAVQQEFKKAQDLDDEAKFGIPDMEISYVTQGNNFDSYTISDTPGPDAAKTSHGESARKAIEKCDVAIFAIDYSKYLTSTEVDYLQEIKKIFEDNNKFHTLIFVLNKMDLALSDKGTKSRIKSIDFIRNRLMTIDQQFKDCIIFATSAQDYYYSIDIRNQSQKHNELIKLLDIETDWYCETRNITDKISDVCDEDLVSTLSNIDAEVSKIKRQIGYDKVNIDIFENYSGVPQLLKHIKYVAQSKAREEIVNNITMTINVNYIKIKSIIDRINNIKILKSKNSDEIKNITLILDDYINEIQSMLTSDINAEDYEKIKDTQGHFPYALKTILERHNFPISQSELIDQLNHDIQLPGELECANKFWENYYARAQALKIMDFQVKGASIPRKSISLTREEINNEIKNYITEYTENELRTNIYVLNDAANNLKTILNDRILRLTHKTDQCKDDLRKNQCGQLLLPELPTFDIEFNRDYLNRSYFYNTVSCNINLPSDITEKSIFTHICEFFSSTAANEDEVYIPDHLAANDIREKLEQGHHAFTNWYSSANIYGILKDACDGLTSEVRALNEKISSAFCDMNSYLMEAVNIIKRDLDDRSTFKDNIDRLNKKETFIQMIQQASDDFMDNWKAIENA